MPEEKNRVLDSFHFPKNNKGLLEVYHEVSSSYKYYEILHGTLNFRVLSIRISQCLIFATDFLHVRIRGAVFDSQFPNLRVLHH